MPGPRAYSTAVFLEIHWIMSPALWGGIIVLSECCAVYSYYFRIFYYYFSYFAA